MFSFLHYSFMKNAILSAIFGGALCGLVGVFVILLRIPFIGVSMAHSALAGAVFGVLFGVNPLLLSIIFCIISAILIGPLSEKGKFDPNLSIGVIFSIVLGIAFIGIGLIKGPRTEALNLLWGNILLVTKKDIIFLIIMLLIFVLFLALKFRHLQFVLFNRELAQVHGLPVKPLFYAMLIITGIAVSLNLNTIGGLLVFSLIINPPLSAYHLTTDFKKLFLLSTGFGILSALVGLFLSYYLNLPSGATIVLTSSFILGLCSFAKS